MQENNTPPPSSPSAPPSNTSNKRPRPSPGDTELGSATTKKQKPATDESKAVAPDAEQHPIFHAALTGNSAAVEQYLLEENDINFVCPQGGTIIALAAQGGHERLVKLLLERGADLNAAPTSGHYEGITPLWWMCCKDQWNLARSILEHAKTHNQLLELNAAPTSGPHQGITAFWGVCCKEQWDLARSILEHAKTHHLPLELNAAPTSGDNQGLTALWWACYKNQWGVALSILEYAKTHKQSLELNVAPISGANQGRTALGWTFYYDELNMALDLMIEYVRAGEPLNLAMSKCTKIQVYTLLCNINDPRLPFDAKRAKVAKDLIDFLLPLLATYSEPEKEEIRQRILKIMILFSQEGYFTYLNACLEHAVLREPATIEACRASAVNKGHFPIAAHLLLALPSDTLSNLHLPDAFMRYLSHQMTRSSGEVGVISTVTGIPDELSEFVVDYADLPTESPKEQSEEVGVISTVTGIPDKLPELVAGYAELPTYGKPIGHYFSVVEELHAARELLEVKDEEMAGLKAELAALKSGRLSRSGDSFSLVELSRATLFGDSSSSKPAIPSTTNALGGLPISAHK